MKRIKATFYCSHLVKMSFVNKVRIILTSLGIFIAVFLFSTGIIIANSYYEGRKSIVSEMRGGAVVLTSPLEPSVVKETLSDVVSLTPVEDVTLLERLPIFSAPVSDRAYFTIAACVHGVTSTAVLRSEYAEGLNIPMDSVLVEGRPITTKDLAEEAEVVVIDELTAGILYPDDSAVGKTVAIGSGAGGSVDVSEGGSEERTATIIGVVKDSQIATEKKLALRRELNSPSVSDVYAEVSLYCPLSTLQKWFADRETVRYSIYDFGHENECSDLTVALDALNRINGGERSFADYCTKSTISETLEGELRYTKMLLNTIVLVLCVLSGLSIMSVTFFSVKERISEIGIRKAFGAGKADIVFQFIFEMVVIAALVSVVSVSLSYYFCRFAENYLASRMYFSFRIHVPAHQLLLPVIVGVLEAVLSSIIPSFYAARVKVTDALRFE